jgi:hypothetical protein
MGIGCGASDEWTKVAQDHLSTDDALMVTEAFERHRRRILTVHRPWLVLTGWERRALWSQQRGAPDQEHRCECCAGEASRQSEHQWACKWAYGRVVTSNSGL